MGLLKSVNNVPDIDYYDYRETMFWGKYKYRVRVHSLGLGIAFRSRSMNGFYNNIDRSPRYAEEVKTEIKNKHLDFEQFIVWKNSLKKQKNMTTRMESNTLALFTNDLDFCKQLRHFKTFDVDITEAISSQYTGVKHFVKQPKHPYRIYLQSKRIDDKTYSDFAQFILNNPKLYPSHSMKRWLKSNNSRHFWTKNWMSAIYYVDYDDESMLTYIMLSFGELTGKKYKLMKHPDIA